jgi:hypothetical protein
MAVVDDLALFVREGLSKGLPRTDIEQVLLKAGWRTEQIRDALRAYADVPFAIPVPRPTPYPSAREAFLYVVMFTTLYIAAFNLGALCFQLIDHWFPDPAWHRNTRAVSEAVRWSVSYLIVVVPVFLYTASLVRKGIEADPARRLTQARRYVTYITLFVASCILLGDFATLIYRFLGGELTVRFVLKTIVVGVIAGSAFWYYLAGLRRDERELEA